MLQLTRAGAGLSRRVLSAQYASRVRFASTARAMVYSAYGDPKEKLSVFEHSIAGPEPSQVVIQLLASPINPADINQVEGVYPSRPALSTDLGTSEPSAVGGNEGVFKVVEVGSKVDGLKVGDWVLPRMLNFGTWRSHAVVEPSQLYKLRSSEGLTPVQAATVSVNPATAHQMLRGFVDLKKGDWFIQNGGNSGVGRAAIQLGRIYGLNSISVVRSRPDIDALKAELHELGATHVLTEEEISDRATASQIRDWTGSRSIRLAFNCVGGKCATNVARQLGNGGQFITYGGMSKQPVTLPTSLFIFKDIVARGYWLSAWTSKEPAAKMAVVEELLELYRTGQLRDVPIQRHQWHVTGTTQQYHDTFEQALEQSKQRKQLIELV